MGKSAKITRFGSHLLNKKLKKGQRNPNEGRRKLRKMMKLAKSAQSTAQAALEPTAST